MDTKIFVHISPPKFGHGRDNFLASFPWEKEHAHDIGSDGLDYGF